MKAPRVVKAPNVMAMLLAGFLLAASNGAASQKGLAEATALSHVWTAPSWQGKTSRRLADRCGHVFGLLVRFT